jgi:hypothetical protein
MMFQNTTVAATLVSKLPPAPKIHRHHITEILLKVALNTINTITKNIHFCKKIFQKFYRKDLSNNILF